MQQIKWNKKEIRSVRKLKGRILFDAIPMKPLK
jgi:hypothetical protein